MNILSLDIGSTSMRGMLFDSNGRILVQHSVETPQICIGERREQDPLLLKRGLISICRAVADSFAVDAVSLTAFRSAPTIVDKNGEHLHNFIMWNDNRSADICDELQKYCPDIKSLCGAPLTTIHTASKLTWLHRNRADLCEAAYKAVVVPDYLIHCMSGEFVTDYTYGSRSLLMPLSTCAWDDDLCRLFEWKKEKLCTLLPPGSIAASISPHFSSLTGIPSGVPVVTAGGDQQCAALGSGVLDPSSLLINNGTGGYILSCASLLPDAHAAVVCGISALPERLLLEASVPACAAAFNDFRAEEFPDLSYFQLDHMVAQAYKGRSGGENIKAQSALAFYRTLAGSISAAAAPFFAARPSIARVYISGGLCKSAIYNQILSDATGRVLYRWRNVQSTAIGAFASAAVALGVFSHHAAALEAVRSWDGCEIYRPSV